MLLRTSGLILSLCVAPAFGQLPGPTQAAIDKAVRQTLSERLVPSASIAIVQDGKLAYAQAYGSARLDPKTQVRPEMRYKIASNSKQFLAAAVLLLAEQGKLSIDDPVSRFLPDLTRAKEVSIRQLLSHTSGYQDFYPLDYLAPFMSRPTAAQGILNTWAKKPLDFDPGTQWQYSNTNYTIAGLIVEKIAGQPLIDFLRARIFDPLGMRSAIDVDRQPWSEADPAGYTRYALGPPRIVPAEAPGWMYAAGELAMSAGDLARWDISLINGTILKPASLAALTTEIRLKNGAATGYALGIATSNTNGRRKWAHGGGANGFVSENFTLPDDRAAVTVLTNEDDSAAHLIASQIEKLLAAGQDVQATASLESARQIFDGLQRGQLDRLLLTDDANAYFSRTVIADFAASLKPLGTPASFTQTSRSLRGGMTFRRYAIRAGSKSLTLKTFSTPDGKIAQYLIAPAAN